MSSRLIFSSARRSDSRLLPSLSRATPSAVSERFSELIGCPISKSLTTCCVCLELRSLASTGVTPLSGNTNLSATPWRPTCPSRAFGWSSLALGLPVLRTFQPFRYLRDCSDCFRLERLPGGACTHWKAPPLHGAHPFRKSATSKHIVLDD